MSTPTAPPPGDRARITGVDGGAGDPEVRRATALAVGYASAARLAGAYDAAAGRLRSWAAAGARTLVDGDLLVSAVLSPLTFAEAEAAVLAATAGPHGTAPAAVAWEADALLVRAAVALLREQDAAAAQLIGARDYAIGYTVGDLTGVLVTAGLPLVVGGAVVGAVIAPVVAPLIPRLEGTLDGALDDLDGWVVDHPGAVRMLADGGGGLLDGLGRGLLGGLPVGVHPTPEAAARDLAILLGPEGPARVTPTVAPPYDAPRDLRALMTGLQATALAPAGTIGLQELAGPDGVRRWVVYLPGTDGFGLAPGDETARDLGADLHLVAGEDTTYGDGIREAMRRAGVGPHEPVLVVGHSAGGMQGLALLDRPGGYDVTHVVTAGSPTAQAPALGHGHVLALESGHDVVPLLDGPSDPSTAARVTVRFVDPGGADTILGRHDLGHYVHGAAAIDRCSDPAIRDQLAWLGPWLDGAPGASYGFVVSR